MNIFQSLGLGAGQFFRNLSFAKENRVICPIHQENLDSFFFDEGLFGKDEPIAACSKCTKPSNTNRKSLARFQGDSLSEPCIVSPILSEKSSGLGFILNPPVDFENLALEHVLCDPQSYGYDLRGLVYMKDQQVLATCSRNGSICFWSIGDKVELKEPKLNLWKTIHFAKYCVISEKKKYFVVGTNKGIHVYNMNEEDGVKLLGVIDEENQASDVDFLKEENKMITVNNESLAKVWSLDSLKNEETIDLLRFDIKRKIFTVIYMERTKELAIEHERGLSVIDWQSRGDNCVKPKVRHHLVAGKDTYGCIHLPKSKKFILNNGIENIQVLKEEDFAELSRHEASKSLFGGATGFPLKFISTEDESQVLSNDRYSSLLQVINEEAHPMTHLLNSFVVNLTDVELMEDQYRFAIAERGKGVVAIHRINANLRIKSRSHEQLLPAVENNWIVPSEVSRLFPLAGDSDSKVVSFKGSSGRAVSSVENNSGGKSNKTPELSKQKPQTSKPLKKGKKIQKAVIPSVMKTRKAPEKKETKRKPKIPTVKPSELSMKKIQGKEDNLTEIVRIRAKKGGKNKAKDEKVWIVFASEDEENKNEKRGRSQEKKGQKQKEKTQKEKRSIGQSEERSRSRSNSKSLTRKSK